jgi:SAM-dependent methyltransferase
VDVGAGEGDVAIALGHLVGRQGRIYAVDVDPAARDLVAESAAAFAQVLALTQSVEDLLLPEAVDLAYCRFLLLHVHDPLVALRSMASSVRPGGWVVAQEPITSAGRIDGLPFSMPDARHPDIGALLPGLVQEAGLELIDAWSESPAGAGPGPVSEYVAELTETDLGKASIVLPPLVTVLAQKPAN